MKKLDILSRKSDLAVIQAHEFGEVLLSKELESNCYVKPAIAIIDNNHDNNNNAHA